jgi:hypothetical protein
MTRFKPELRLLAAFGAGAALLAGCASSTAEPETAAAAAAPAAPQWPEGCEPSGALAYLCGVDNAEDIVPVGTTRWLLASNLAPLGGEVGAGKIYLIDSQAKTAEELFPGPAPVMRHDAAMFPNCPSIDLQHFDTHGLALRETSPGVYRLYSTSHGAVEAIQAWELDATGDKPTVAWVGCVPLPGNNMFNSVAILADGGFVTTLFMDRSDPQAFAKINQGQINGAVYEWRPGGAVIAIPGTELSGPNGIELSADDRFMFVAAFGGHEVVRFDRGPNPTPKASAAVEVSPDNLRWSEAGTLLTVGGNLTPNTGWSIFEVDPSTMESRKLAGVDQNAALQGAATALQVGDEIWIGPYSGDRVGYYRAQ